MLVNLVSEAYLEQKEGNAVPLFLIENGRSFSRLLPARLPDLEWEKGTMSSQTWSKELTFCFFVIQEGRLGHLGVSRKKNSYY